jgi:hypothetical protein
MVPSLPLRSGMARSPGKYTGLQFPGSRRAFRAAGVLFRPAGALPAVVSHPYRRGHIGSSASRSDSRKTRNRFPLANFASSSLDQPRPDNSAINRG